MRNKLLIAVFLIAICTGSPAFAAQPLDDVLEVDTLEFVDFEVDTIGGTMVMEIWVFSDYHLSGATAGFTWRESSANLTLDTAYASALLITGFAEIGPFVYFDTSLTKSNDSSVALIGGASIFSPGIPAASVRRLWATYEFTLDWSPGDSIVIDTLKFNAGSELAFSITTTNPATLRLPYHERYVFKAETDVTEASAGDLPDKFALNQNYPNPFNPTTEIEFDVPTLAHVNITVFNILGQEVETLVDKELSAGKYTADWDGSGFASGVYFYKFETDTYTETRKMVLVK
ncbi:MAG: T9SS type A sorting domain-containing protein [candidate division Zixibacteria bacterium]|nr:T9SS type A sorting domain-containing protein [candidate division Zixibacteria bacterium]